LTSAEFRALPSPPESASDALIALWIDANESWTASHDTLQDDQTADGAWVHAYLHRKEGDLPNASYWYRRAGKPVFSGSLDDEWSQIVSALLG
jgi:hypothetical protein